MTEADVEIHFEFDAQKRVSGIVISFAGTDTLAKRVPAEEGKS